MHYDIDAKLNNRRRSAAVEAKAQHKLRLPLSVSFRSFAGIIVLSFALMMVLTCLPIGIMTESLAYDATVRTQVDDAGDVSDNRKDRLVRFFFYYKACWKNRPIEELADVSEVLGDGDTDYYPRELELCDQFRIVARSLLGDSLDYGESIIDNDDVVYTSSDESIFEISGDGKLTLHKKGKAFLTVFVRGDEVYRDCTVRLPIQIARWPGFLTEAGYTVKWSSTDEIGITVSTADGPQQLQVWLKPGASVTFSSQFPDIACVDENGLVTPVSPGKTKIYTYCDEGDHGQYEPCLLYNEITVTGEDIRSAQSIEGSTDDITIGCGGTVQLQMTAMTALSFRSLNNNVASVSSDGIVTGIKGGTAVIIISAASSKEYRSASSEVKIIVRDYEAEAAAELARQEAERLERERQEEAARQEQARQEEAARQEQTRQQEAAGQEQARQQETARQEQERQNAIRQARSLKSPKLRLTAKKKKNKLSWNMVAGASGYQLYIKYPGAKKYVSALTKDASVKSVTHRGLSRRMKYSYKIRAFAVVDGKYYYGPFSKAKTVRVR